SAGTASSRAQCDRSQARSLHPRGRFCPLGRTGGRGRACRSRPHPRGRDGRTLRAEPFPGRSRRRVAAQGDAPAAGGAPDDSQSRLFPRRIRAGRPDLFFVAWEGNNDPSRTVQHIKGLGKRVGVAINPATPAAVLEEIMPDIDQVLVMTVNPGFGHQHFLPTTLPKIARAREMIDRIKPGCSLEVDGGVDATTAPLAVAAGADVLVAGSAIFNGSEGVTAAMQRVR